MSFDCIENALQWRALCTELVNNHPAPGLSLGGPVSAGPGDSDGGGCVGCQHRLHRLAGRHTGAAVTEAAASGPTPLRRAGRGVAAYRVYDWTEAGSDCGAALPAGRWTADWRSFPTGGGGVGAGVAPWSAWCWAVPLYPPGYLTSATYLSDCAHRLSLTPVKDGFKHRPVIVSEGDAGRK